MAYEFKGGIDLTDYIKAREKRILQLRQVAAEKDQEADTIRRELDILEQSIVEVKKA